MTVRITIFTSTKVVMFPSLSVCLFVGLFVGMARYMIQHMWCNYELYEIQL